MSGGGGGGGGGGGSDNVPCEELKFDAQLTSPQPSLVKELSVGQVLDVNIVNVKGQQLLQVLKNGQPVGGLIGSDAARLRECILGGHHFNATVMSINGGQVRVHIEHA
jgi:hypothetical protein